jgi:hypothetical protein
VLEEPMKKSLGKILPLRYRKTTPRVCLTEKVKGGG